MECLQMKYEYKFVLFQDYDFATQTEFNKLGADGWELIHLINVNTSRRGIFKRIINERG